jgi:plastocyanin domain-containing protein
MLSRGFSLSGVSLTGGILPNASNTDGTATLEGNVQTITTKLQPRSYSPLTVQKGVPVRWIIEADAGAINGCNGTIIIPKYNISKTLKPGENEIQFTPDAEGIIPYSCWMGMIRSSITVVSDDTDS